MNFVEQAILTNNDMNRHDSAFNLSKSILNKIIKSDITHYMLWKETYSSKIYKIKTNKRTIIAKQGKSPAPEELEKEYESLGVLKEIESDYLLIPNTYGLDKANNFYLIDLVEGDSISQLVQERNQNHTILEASKIAGKVLGDIHNYWTEKVGIYENSYALLNDIKKIPGGLTAKEKKVLEPAIAQMAQTNIPVGLVYKDYDPLNIYYKEGKISLIDPPQIFAETIMYWDVATFTVGLKKASLKKINFSKDKVSLEECEEIFIDEYLKSINLENFKLQEFKLILKIMEIQRCAQLMAYQEVNRKRNRIFSKNRIHHNIALYLLRKEIKKAINEIEIMMM